MDEQAQKYWRGKVKDAEAKADRFKRIITNQRRALIIAWLVIMAFWIMLNQSCVHYSKVNRMERRAIADYLKYMGVEPDEPRTPDRKIPVRGQRH